MFTSINSVDIKNGESCFAAITAYKGKPILCTVINSITEEIILYQEFDGVDEKSFIKKIFFNNKIYKAVIVNAFKQNSKGFCSDLREKLNKLKIPNYFFSQEILISTSMLIAANINVNFDETVLTIFVNSSKIMFAEMKYTPQGYETIRRDSIEYDKNYNVSKLRDQIMGTSTPKKIMAFQHSSSIPVKNCQDKCLVECCKWLLDKSYTKHFILPTYVRQLLVAIGYRQHDVIDYGQKVKARKIIITLKLGDTLPLTKSVEFQRSVLQCWIEFRYDDQNRTCCKLELNKKCHRFRFNITIDSESFETYNIEQIFLKEVESSPQKLDAIMERNIPVIGFFDNSSVVCINKNGNYQFSDNCNGSIGMDNFISFDEKKPKYGEAALNVMNDKATYVVFDFLKILLMPKDNTEISETWGF